MKTFTSTAQEITTELDLARNRKSYKKAHKELLNLVFTEELYISINDTYKGNYIALVLSITKMTEATDKLGYTNLQQYLDHPKPEDKAARQLWIDYNNCQGVFYGTLKSDLKTISKRDAKEILGVFLDVFANEKRDTIIANSLMVKITRALDITEDVAMQHLDIWSTTGIITHKYVQSTEEKLEHRYQFNIDIKHLREVAKYTSKRNIKFTEPKEINSNLCIIKKHKYIQPLSDTSITGIQHMNATAFHLNMTQEELEQAIHMELFGLTDTTSVITEPWQEEIANAMRSEYNLIMSTGNTFYVDHATDGAMRLYTNSNYFSVQKGSWMRKHLALDEEQLTFSGKIELKRYIAMECTKGKLTYKQADEAFIKHSQEWKEQGLCQREFNSLDTGYSNILGQQDSQSSNYQIYGVCLGDSDILSHTGINGDYRSDFRDVVSHLMNQDLQTTIWTKDNLKPAAMTKGYSAKYKTLMFGSNYDEEFGIINPKGKAIPLMSVSNRSAEDTWEAFNTAMHTTMGKALRAMTVIEKAGASNTKTVIQWELPDGQIAQIAPQLNNKHLIKWASANGKVHTLTHHTSLPNPKGATTALAPRIIQSIDAYIVRRVSYILESMNIPFCAVHDEFITHFNYCKQVREVVRNVLLEIFESNLLSNIVTQITGKPVNFQNKIDKPKIRSMIESSQYHICY